MKFPSPPARKGLSSTSKAGARPGSTRRHRRLKRLFAVHKAHPSVFCVQSFAEGYIVHGKRFTPVKHQALLASDLPNLPQFLCRSDDLVLVAQRPSIEFLSAVKHAGFPLPEFVELEGARN